MRTITLLALVFTLILCLVGCAKMQVADNPATTDNVPTTDNHTTVDDSSTYDTQGDLAMEQIWSITDTNDFVIAMAEHITEKAQYGDNVAALSEAERIFYITQTLEMEVNNGGFSQFFYNSSGNFSNELVSAFTAIGANKTAAICQKAIDAFGRELPIDWDARREMLDELESEDFYEILEECDSAFFDYEDDLNELNYSFVMKNKEQFT